MHCLLHWLLGKLLLNPHLCPVCFLEKALFPLLLQGETGRSCEGVSPEIYTRSRRISCAPFLSGTVEYNAHLHLYSLLKSFNHQRPGKYKHNPGHTQWRNDCSLLCVCVYIFWWLFWSSSLAAGENMDSTLRTWSQGIETSSLRHTFYSTMPYIITTFSFPKPLIPPVSTCSLSLRQIIPHSFGGLAELTAKLSCYLRIQLQS